MRIAIGLLLAFVIVAAIILATIHRRPPDLALERVDVLDQPISDHLPVSVEIRLPDNLRDKALVVRGDAGSPP